ncbi:hypothetical protein RRG08_016994 [Elysia crispata]|uniref:Uncharacterized protein n=1 Tax=Elysia crispata TaxID=231223 RepID=A0AAE0XYQ9_9GAST|nr:hypothetical protein RRG08_016994 [Elysia crispata]
MQHQHSTGEISDLWLCTKPADISPQIARLRPFNVSIHLNPGSNVLGFSAHGERSDHKLQGGIEGKNSGERSACTRRHWKSPGVMCTSFACPTRYVSEKDRSSVSGGSSCLLPEHERVFPLGCDSSANVFRTIYGPRHWEHIEQEGLTNPYQRVRIVAAHQKSSVTLHRRRAILLVVGMIACQHGSSSASKQRLLSR